MPLYNSKLNRFFIYLFPLLIDMVLSTLFFVCSLRMAESGAGAFAVSMVCTAWALTYAVTSLCAGRFLNNGNIVFYTVASCLALTVLSLLFVLLPFLYLQYVLMVCSGIFIALFYTPFQVFMKAVMGQTRWGLNVSTGLYTAAWSAGMALGPFVSGFLWQAFNWQVCHLVNAGAALFCALGIYRLRHYAVFTPAEAPDNESTVRSGAPDLVMCGWFCGGICFLIVSVVRAVYPSWATSLTVSKFDQGVMFALLFGAQSFMGLLLCLYKQWMYRLYPILIVSLIGALGTLLLGIGRTAPVFFLAALMIGIYSGMACCYFVYHALADHRRSTRNVAINETIVGLTGIFGPVLGGLLADAAGLAIPFYASALLVGAAILIQYRIRSGIVADEKNSLSTVGAAPKSDLGD